MQPIQSVLWTTHLVLVSSEAFDLLLCVQAPQSDREVVGRGHQQPAGQRVELDGVNLLSVACDGVTVAVSQLCQFLKEAAS